MTRAATRLRRAAPSCFSPTVQQALDVGGQQEGEGRKPRCDEAHPGGGDRHANQPKPHCSARVCRRETRRGEGGPAWHPPHHRRRQGGEGAGHRGRAAGALSRPLAGHRDRALLALGFAGAFRRSELVALRVEDLVETPDGLPVTIRPSKADQEGQGAEVAILRGCCPARLRPCSLGWLLPRSPTARCSGRPPLAATLGRRPRRQQRQSHREAIRPAGRAGFHQRATVHLKPIASRSGTEQRLVGRRRAGFPQPQCSGIGA